MCVLISLEIRCQVFFFSFTLLLLFFARHICTLVRMKKVCDEINDWKFDWTYGIQCTGIMWLAGYFWSSVNNILTLLCFAFACSLLLFLFLVLVFFSFLRRHTYVRERAVLLFWHVSAFRLLYYSLTNNAIRCMGQTAASGCIQISNKRLQNEFFKSIIKSVWAVV